jgi:hypothetical protein
MSYPVSSIINGPLCVSLESTASIIGVDVYMSKDNRTDITGS